MDICSTQVPEGVICLICYLRYLAKLVFFFIPVVVKTLVELFFFFECLCFLS